MKKIKVQEVGLALAISVLSWIFPIIFLYAQNVKEMNFNEISGPLAGAILCAAGVLLVFWLVFRDWNVAAIGNVASALLLSNFQVMLSFVQRVFTGLRYWHLMFLVVLAIVLLTGLLKCKSKMNKDIVLIGSIVFAALISINLVGAIPVGIQKMNDRKAQNENIVQDNIEQKNNRNIYYLLCDEYASFEQMSVDFDFENKEFLDFLSDNHFYVSQSSRNDSCKTVVVLANIMQLDYIATDDSTSVELEQLTKNGKVQSILREQGYSLTGIGDTAWLGIEGTIEGEEGATTAEGKNAKQIFIDNSFLAPFFHVNYTEEAKEIVQSFEELQNMNIEPNSSKFVLFYVVAPHHPYYLTATGEMNMPDKWINDGTGKNNEAYIGEVEYVNAQLKIAISRIIKNDPDSIIVLCSDHGNRFGIITGDLTTKILNAVYYSGEYREEFEGLSGINTLIEIFNQEFGTGLEYRELPNN